MKPKVTLTDIANEAGVSVATVSRLLSGKGRVSEATREKLLGVIRQYSYDTRNLSRALKKDRTKTVGVVIQQLGHPYFIQACAALETGLRDRGLAMFLAVGTNNPEIEEKTIQLLLDKGVDGLVVLGGSTNFPQPAVRFQAVITAALERCPVGFFNGYFEVPGVVQVRSDEAKGFRELLDRAYSAGHRRFGYLGGDPGAGASLIRKQTFLAWSHEHNLEVRPEWVLEPGFSIRHGAQAIGTLLTWKDSPTVVVCCNDIVAAGALGTLRERGYRVPEDISVLGFDGMDMEEYPFPEITSAAQRYRELAQSLLDRLLAGEAGPELVLIPTIPVAGKTLGPPGAVVLGKK